MSVIDVCKHGNQRYYCIRCSLDRICDHGTYKLGCGECNDTKSQTDPKFKSLEENKYSLQMELPKSPVFSENLLELMNNITKHGGSIYGGFVSNVLIPACYGQKLKYRPYISEQDHVMNQKEFSDFLETFADIKIIDYHIDIDICFTNPEDMCHFLLDTFGNHSTIETNLPRSQMTDWYFNLKSKEYFPVRGCVSNDEDMRTENYANYPPVSKEFIEMLNFAKLNNGIMCYFGRSIYDIYLDIVSCPPIINDFNCNLIKAQVTDGKVTYSLIESENFPAYNLDSLLNSVANNEVRVTKSYLAQSGFSLETIKKWIVDPDFAYQNNKAAERISTLLSRGYNVMVEE